MLTEIYYEVDEFNKQYLEKIAVYATKVEWYPKRQLEYERNHKSKGRTVSRRCGLTKVCRPAHHPSYSKNRKLVSLCYK